MLRPPPVRTGRENVERILVPIVADGSFCGAFPLFTEPECPLGLRGLLVPPMRLEGDLLVDLPVLDENDEDFPPTLPDFGRDLVLLLDRLRFDFDMSPPLRYVWLILSDFGMKARNRMDQLATLLTRLDLRTEVDRHGGISGRKGAPAER
jgi:hypothetical protein